MKWFFEDEPKQEPPKQNRPFFEQLALDTLKACFVLIRGTLERFLDWIAKPLLSIFFSLIDPRGKSERGITVLCMGCAVLLLALYKVPYIRGMTLSNSHMLNLGEDSFTLPFPALRYFEMTESTDATYVQDRGQVMYLTYGRDVGDKSIPGIQDTCYLVPRGKRLNLVSSTLPTYAVGFHDKVTYVVDKPAKELSGWRKVSWFIAHPSKLFASKEELEGITVVYGQDATWNELQEGWSQVWSYSNGKKPFEVKALWNQNAIICF